MLSKILRYPLLFAVFLLVCSAPAFGQTGGFVAPASGNLNGTGAPTGACQAGALYTNNSNGNIYGCSSGTWVLSGGGGGGTITSCTTTGGVAFQNGTINTGTCLPQFTYQAVTPPAGSNFAIETAADGSLSLTATPDGIASQSINFDVDGNMYFSPVPGKDFTLPGSITGAFKMHVNSNAGSPNPWVMPGLTGAPGTYLQTDGGNPQQLSWQPALAGGLNWQRLGTVLGVPSANGFFQEPSAFVQTTPQVLSGFPQVIGLLFTADSTADSIYYAEAVNPVGPFTFYSSNGIGAAPTAVVSGAACASNVLTLGGNLVMFACNTRTDIHRYHSATHGISWVDDGAVITHNTKPWYSVSVNNSSILVVGGTCFLWFDGSNDGINTFAQGLFTGNATCDVGSFTENAGDPVIPASEFIGGGPFVFNDGTNYWQWELGNGTAASDYPSNIYAVELNTNGAGSIAPHTHTKVFTARYADEGANQATNTDSQVADPFLFEWPNAQGDANNSTYLYYTSCAKFCTGNEQMSLKVAVIKTPIKNIVGAAFATQTDTTAQTIAIPPVYSTCNDFGTRADSNPPGPLWGATGGTTTVAKNIKIVSNVFEPTTVNVASRASYNGCYFPTSQYSSVVFSAAAATSAIGPTVNGLPGNTSGPSAYECVTVAALGGSQSMVLRKLVNGSVSATLATFTATPAVNDVWEIDRTGTNPAHVTCKQNGTVVATGNDASTPLIGGQPGIVLFDSAAVANAQIKNWTAGGL